jgi:hypothetical protein
MCSASGASSSCTICLDLFRALGLMASVASEQLNQLRFNFRRLPLPCRKLGAATGGLGERVEQDLAGTDTC